MPVCQHHSLFEVAQRPTFQPIFIEDDGYIGYHEFGYGEAVFVSHWHCDDCQTAWPAGKDGDEARMVEAVLAARAAIGAQS